MRITYIYIICVLSMLAGCASGSKSISALDHYDKCMGDTSLSFESMIACGKKSRNDYCMTVNTCGGDGNASVAYGDSLVQSVKNKEFSESEARRKWIEYRNNRNDSYERNENAAATAAAARDAARAASSIKTCEKSGNSITCY